MDTKFKEILAGLPEKPARSRLEPYQELIKELRRRGRTYREIGEILGEKCQVQVTASGVHDFVENEIASQASCRCDENRSRCVRDEQRRFRSPPSFHRHAILIPFRDRAQWIFSERPQAEFIGAAPKPAPKLGMLEQIFA